MTPDEDGKPRWELRSVLNGVRFGFWIEGTGVEFVSASHSKAVVAGFKDLFRKLSSRYTVVELTEKQAYSLGEKEITVNGDVQANFWKVKRAHSVRFTVNPVPYFKR